MSTPSKEDITRLKFAKVMRTYQEAEKMFEFNFYHAARNRTYYACFYTATALLYSIDIHTKTHSGVKQNSGRHFIKTGFLPESTGLFYSNIFLSRQSADYDDFADPTAHMVKEYLVNAKEFLQLPKRC